MAKLTTALTPQQVARFRGILDIYQSHGQTIARSWPKKQRRIQTPGERLAQCYLKAANFKYQGTPQWLKDEYSEALSGLWWTSRDYFMIHYLGTADFLQPIFPPHHPPQPQPCPGGHGHYWALLDQYATILNEHAYRLYFVFDQPLVYNILIQRPRPPLNIFTEQRRGVTCQMGTLPPLNTFELSFKSLQKIGPNLYSTTFFGFPGEFGVDAGRWYGYIRGIHPDTGHRAISISPWFYWQVPAREDFITETPAPAMAVHNRWDRLRFGDVNEIRDPRSEIDLRAYVWDVIH